MNAYLSDEKLCSSCRYRRPNTRYGGSLCLPCWQALTPRAKEAATKGEVLFAGRYLAREMVVARLLKEKQWKGATVTDTEDAWILMRGSAVARVFKRPGVKGVL